MRNEKVSFILKADRILIVAYFCAYVLITFKPYLLLHTFVHRIN